MKSITRLIFMLVFLSASVLAVWAGPQSEGTAADEIPKIELMQQGWVNQPTDENDPFRAWLNETFGVDITMNNTSEFNNEILTRFATDDPPDIISFSGTVQEAYVRQLYDEGFLVEDWYAHKSSIPAWLRYMDDNAEKYFTVDGKLIALCQAGPPNIWGFQIRKDWLATLGKSVPTTPDELLDVAKAFTFDDPDGNGKDDTWGLTSAGGGASVGEISNLKLMWGPTNFYIKDNKVTHYVLDGTEKAFLDLMRIAVNEEIIEPNWYTIAWNERKAPLFQAVLGTAWYPGVLVTEFMTEGMWDPDDAAKLWTHMPMPKGSPDGGKLYPPAFYDRMNTVSAKAEGDSVKFGKIVKLLEGVAYPNPGYDNLRWGVDIDKGRIVELPRGYKIVLAGPGEDRYRSVENFLGAADWGKWHSTRADFTIFSSGTTEADIPPTAYAEIELNSGALDEPVYGSDALFIHLDKTVEGELIDLMNEFEYKYISGATDDYDGFMRSWLSAGGQELLDDATVQFKQLGMIK